MKLETPQLDIGLVTADASKSRSFYREVLEFREEESRSFGGDAVQYRFRAGDQLIKFMVVMPDEVDEDLRAFMTKWRENHAHDPRKSLKDRS